MIAPLLAARVVMGVAGAGLLATAVWVARRRETAALRPFALFVGVVGSLAVADAAAAGALTSLSVVWLLTVLAIPAAFTWFVIEYYGLPYLASPRRKAAFLAPVAVALAGGIALILSPESSGSMAGGGPTAPAVPAPLGFAALAEQIGLYYAGGVMIAGVALLALTVAEYDYLDRRLAAVLSFVAVWPWLAYMVTPAIANRVGTSSIIGLNATGYTLSLAAVGFAVTRGGIFDAAPAAGTLGPETVLADLDDAVVVVDRDERIVTLNDAAADAFGVEPAAATAEPLSACVGFDLDTLRDSDTVELSGPDGSRQFEATVSPVSDQFDRQPGYAIVFTDVTQQRVRSQRLSVLNRVLRHNLRNEMNKIRGRAELIADGGQEYVDHAETIVSSADDLIATGERARQVEQMMATTAAVEEAASLAAIGEAVIEEYRSEYPDATLSVDIDNSLRAPVNEQVLAHVLDNLVENAIVHNDAPTPVVTVGARATDDGVEVSVADNGPGIPNTERAVIESGDEDDLDHGSGLGLWAVKWGAVRLGGEIAFADRKPRGTVVTITLPTEPSAETATAATAAAD
ncbi:PAS domain-containing protein [Halonotius sp. F2-221B]|uniref:ATP-binding protein n=1 Tax=Halonotius sp. F2-221B TaxID=2731620 RepID=UPI00398AC63D